MDGQRFPPVEKQETGLSDLYVAVVCPPALLILNHCFDRGEAEPEGVARRPYILQQQKALSIFFLLVLRYSITYILMCIPSGRRDADAHVILILVCNTLERRKHRELIVNLLAILGEQKRTTSTV